MMNSFINLIIWKKRKYTQNTLLWNKLLHKNNYIWHWVIISIEMISDVGIHEIYSNTTTASCMEFLCDGLITSPLIQRSVTPAEK